METSFEQMEISMKEAEALGYLFSRPSGDELLKFIEDYGDLVRRVTIENIDDDPRILSDKIVEEVSKKMES